MLQPLLRNASLSASPLGAKWRHPQKTEMKGLFPRKGKAGPREPWGPRCSEPCDQLLRVLGPQARKALTERQRDLEMKTQQLEIKLSNKTEEDIKKARRKSTQAGECGEPWPTCPHLGKGAQQGEGWG